jgi:hypothetical protein
MLPILGSVPSGATKPNTTNGSLANRGNAPLKLDLELLNSSFPE